MNSALVGKVMGWGQFALQCFAQLATAGLPHNAIGWVSTLGSLAMAVGVHAAASTDGAK